MHIYTSNILLTKDKDGNWFVSKIFTGAGNFDLGSEVSEELQVALGNVADEVKKKIVPQIEKHIENENKSS